jgi:NADPH-dependent curcumin reductase CurA
VINYRTGPILRGLGTAAPDGVDVYFDNVGGDHLDAALALARNNARFAICGMIEGYNKSEPTSLRFIMRVIAARIQLKGFIVFDFQARMGEFYRDMGGWLANGQVKSRETVVDGLEAMPDAFLGLFSGANTGKMLVRL